MRAQTGDWLIVHSHTEGSHNRKAEILATHGDGEPPYTVRWLDEERETVVFPGPDAEIVSAARLAEMDRTQTGLITRVQGSIGSSTPAG